MEKAKLANFEVGYQQEVDMQGTRLSAIAYVAGASHTQYTPKMGSRSSEEYLTAIHVHLCDN